MRSSTKSPLALVPALLLAACGAAPGGGTDWYYHWSCNGDSECLSLNPTGEASGTVGPESGGQAGCNSLMTFGSKFFNIPPATQSCDTSPNAPPPTITSLTIAPANSSLPLGLTKQFTCTGHYSDGTSKDLTSQCTWGTSATPIGSTPVATVNAGGLVTAGARGTITIIADHGPHRATTQLTVGAAAIQTISVAPATATIPSGTTQAFTATAHYSDGATQNVTAQVTWTSADPSVATVSAAGVATGVAPGTVTIIATRLGVSGNATLTVGAPLLVSIAVTPSDPTVPRTFTSQLRATGTYSDGSAQDVTGLVAWTSGTPAVASVDGGGLATGLEAGTSTITATSGAISGATTLTVSAATLASIAVVPAEPIIEPGTTVPLAAVGTFSDGSSRILATGVSWSSDATAVATVSAIGVAAGVTVGSATITATFGGLSGSTLLTVTLTPPGATWTFDPGSPVMAPCASGCAFVHFELTAVVWSGSQFVTVANDGGIFSSPDGLTWTVRVPGPDLSGPGSDLRGVAWSPTLLRFVAVGNGYVTTSSDLGVSWTPSAAAPISGKLLNGVTWSGTQFVAVGNGAILTSPDGLTWTARAPGTAAALRSVVWTGSRYVAVGDVTLTSLDGNQWTQEADGGTSWTGIAWSGSKLVEVGSTGGVRTSPDGTTWTSEPAQAMPLNAVIWTGTQWVAVGGIGPLASPGYVITSPDGRTWTSRTIGAIGTTFGLSQTLFGVAWSGTTLVAVGDHYNVYTSP